VEVRLLDASGFLARQQHPGDRQPTMFREAREHCLTGPIAVRGARPGLVLSVQLVSLRPGDWGWTVAAATEDRLKQRLGVAEGSAGSVPVRAGCCRPSSARAPTS
jgi:acetamidase/formamidase